MSRYKNIALLFSLLKTAFFYFFYFSIYKVVDNEYSTDYYKSSKINIAAVIKNLEMLKFVSDHLKSIKNVQVCS